MDFRYFELIQSLSLCQTEGLILNLTNCSFVLTNINTQLVQLNSLLYMNNIKLFASTKNQLEEMLNMVEMFFNDIGMQFGIIDWRKTNIESLLRTDHQVHYKGETGIATHLNSKNVFKVLNTYAFSALSYSFVIIDWRKTDIGNLQREFGVLLSKA